MEMNFVSICMLAMAVSGLAQVQNQNNSRGDDLKPLQKHTDRQPGTHIELGTLGTIKYNLVNIGR